MSSKNPRQEKRKQLQEHPGIFGDAAAYLGYKIGDIKECSNCGSYHFQDEECPRRPLRRYPSRQDLRAEALEDIAASDEPGLSREERRLQNLYELAQEERDQAESSQRQQERLQGVLKSNTAKHTRPAKPKRKVTFEGVSSPDGSGMADKGKGKDKDKT